MRNPDEMRNPDCLRVAPAKSENPFWVANKINPRLGECRCRCTPTLALLKPRCYPTTRPCTEPTSGAIGTPHPSHLAASAPFPRWCPVSGTPNQPSTFVAAHSSQQGSQGARHEGGQHRRFALRSTYPHRNATEHLAAGRWPWCVLQVRPAWPLGQSMPSTNFRMVPHSGLARSSMIQYTQLEILTRRARWRAAKAMEL